MKIKLLIIGIDSLEPSLVKKFVETGDSRGFIHFYQYGKLIPMKSTFPPDTVLAWPTIYTGLIHQRFKLKPEPESPRELKRIALETREKLRGNTFWDIASQSGKRVCVINPLFAYPPWKVNGMIVSGPTFGISGPTLSHPLIKNVTDYKLGTYAKTPILFHEYKEMYNDAIDHMLEIFNLAKMLINRESYDLIFVADYTLDRIQHYFWRFYDKDDPSKPLLINAYEKYIENYYKIIDRLLANIVNKYNDEYTIVVFGDHGHRRRPSKLISIEKILNNRHSVLNPKAILRDILYLYAYYARADSYMYKIIRFLQDKGKLKRLLLKERSKDTEKYLVKTLKEFGLKEYVGLKLNLDSQRENELVYRSLKRLLDLGMLDFVIKPEEFYGVSDIVYEADLYIKLKDDLGNYPESNSFLIIPNYTKHIISGGHSMYTLFMLSLPRPEENKIEIRAPEMRVHDVTPTLLELMSLKYEPAKHFDGKSVVKISK